jgi:hypothetical protein
MRVFVNRVLSKIFGSKRDEVTGEWRRLRSKELYDIYCAPNKMRVIKSRRVRWAGHVARIGDGREARGAYVESPEGKRPLGKPRRRWEDNTRIDLQEVGPGSVE